MDNRGGAGTLYGISAYTNDQGVAEVEFNVGWRPGDNYRIFAHGLNTFSDSFTAQFDVVAKQNDGDQARLQYARGAGGLVNGNYYSNLLTVWRKLHVERDSMGAPQAGHVFGLEIGTSTNLTNDTLTDATKNWPLADLNGGLLDPNTGDQIPEAFEVDWNGPDTLGIVGAGLTLNATAGDPYAVDTDDADLGDLPTPDGTLLEEALKESYIEVVYDTGKEDNNVEWRRYGDSLGNLGDTWRGTKTWEAEDFWSAYILAAYEGVEEKDRDPDTEAVQYGITTTTGEPEYSAVLLEVLRDRGYGVAAHRLVVAHEIGHQFGLNLTDDPAHPQTCIMYPYVSSALRFSDHCKAIIRSTRSP